MADEQHRAAAPGDLGYLAEALLLKLGIPDREHLVHDEDLDASLDRYTAFARLGDARQDFQKRSLAGAVAADNPQDFAAPHLEADVPQRPELLDRVAGEHGAAARQIECLAPGAAGAA